MTRLVGEVVVDQQGASRSTTIILNSPQSNSPKPPGSKSCEDKRVGWYRCPEGHLRKIETGCGALRCLDCYEETRRRRKQSAWEKFGVIRAVTGILIFTIPEQLRAQAQGDLLDKWRKRSMKLLEHWLSWRVGVSRDFSWGGGEWTHPEGDKQPGVWTPHLNFMFPLLLLDLKKGKAKVIPTYASTSELGVLRRAYRLLLRDVFDCEIIGEVDVKYKYRRGIGDKRHAMKYYPRPFPEWADLKVNKTRWYGFLSNATWNKKGKEALARAGRFQVQTSHNAQDENGNEFGDWEPGVVRCKECQKPMMQVAFGEMTPKEEKVFRRKWAAKTPIEILRFEKRARIRRGA